jgi:hypothetical protein
MTVATPLQEEAQLYEGDPHRPSYKHSVSDISVMTAATEALSILTSEDNEDFSDNASFIDPSLDGFRFSSRSSEDGQNNDVDEHDVGVVGNNVPTSAAALSSSSSSFSSSKAVSFGTILIREYERIPGDHPETSMGVPLTIGWKFVQRKPVSVEDFERSQSKLRRKRRQISTLGSTFDDHHHHHNNGGSGGSGHDATTVMMLLKAPGVKRIGPLERKSLLLKEFLVPLEDIRMAEHKLEKFKRQLEKRKLKERLEKNGELPPPSLAKKIKKGFCRLLHLRPVME